MAFKESPQFLHMLQAEEEGLIRIEVQVQEPQTESFVGTLVRCSRSDEYGEISKEWNELREAVCRDLVNRLLLPMGSKWIREHLRGEAEDYVAERCRLELEFVSHLLEMGKELTNSESMSGLIKVETWNLAKHHLSSPFPSVEEMFEMPSLRSYLTKMEMSDRKTNSIISKTNSTKLPFSNYSINVFPKSSLLVAYPSILPDYVMMPIPP
jgi:hypothetical protein